MDLQSIFLRLFWRWSFTNLSWPQIMMLPISSSQVTRITGVRHQHAVCWQHRYWGLNSASCLWGTHFTAWDTSQPCMHGTGLWSQALCHLSHALRSFCFTYFSSRVSCLHPGLPGSPSSWLHLSCCRMTRSNHHTQLIGWDGISRTFCLGWPWTAVFQISTSWVAGIIAVSNYTQLIVNFS
jgi:hypothetical protein